MEERENQERFGKLGEVFRLFAEYVKNEGGNVMIDQSVPDDLGLVVLVDSIDFYKDYMTRFVECLPLVDELRITNTGDDSIEIRMAVKDRVVPGE